MGSAWCCGAGTQGLVREDDEPAPEREPVSSYLVHKTEAEARLARLPDLPLAIACPSLALGHSERGCEPSASLFWALRVLDQARGLPWAARSWSKRATTCRNV